MAAAAPSPLASSVEKTNGAKLSRLLIDGGTTVLRNVFDGYHPPTVLAANLSTNCVTLNNLFRRKVLHKPQWDLLFPPGGATPDSKTFDITLLFLLLTNICGLSPPLSGWHKPPPSFDTSLEANLARVKLYRNELYGHVTSTGLQTAVFNVKWQEIGAFLIALGLNPAEVVRLRSAPCGNDYISAVIEWVKSDEEIKSQLREVLETQQEARQIQEEDHRTLHDTHKAVEGVQQIQQDMHQVVEDVLTIQQEEHQKQQKARQIQEEDHRTLQDTHQVVEKVLKIQEARQIQEEDHRTLEDTHKAVKRVQHIYQDTHRVVEKVRKTQEEVVKTQKEDHETLQQVKTTVENMAERCNKDKEDEILSKLAKINTQKAIEYHAERYQEGTRLSFFENVEKWLDDRSSSNRVMVISGNAGMGKSVISAVVCKRMQQADRLSGSHFCQHDKARYRNGKVLLQSLACQLSDSLPEYKNTLVNTLSTNLGVELNHMEVKDLFEVLFEEPLSKLKDPDRNILMVIDGLDESEYQGRNELLDVIANHFTKLPPWIRFLVTTRPEINIVDSLKSFNPLQLEPKDKENLMDLRLLFKKRLSDVIQKSLQEIIITELVKRSEGLILYAHLLVLFVKESVSLLTPEQLDNTLPSGISSVYQTYFKRLEKELCKELKITEVQFLIFVSALTAAREPLPLDFITKMMLLGTSSLADQRKVEKAIACISALLPVRDDCVHFFHKSVRDWLTDTSLYGRHNFTVVEKEGHRILTELCTDELDDIKRTGVGSAQFSGTEKYALKHCVKHVLQLKEDARSCISLEVVIKKYVVDLELVYAKLCVSNATASEDILQIQKQEIFPLLSEDCKDLLNTFAFLLKKYFSAITNHPPRVLQIVLNAGGTPLSSVASNLLKNIYPEIPYMEFVHKQMQQGAVLARFQCSSYVACYDVSPRLDYMVCECTDGTIQLWSLHTGKLEWTRPVMVKKRNWISMKGKTSSPSHIRSFYRSSFLDVFSIYRSVVFHPTADVVLPGVLNQAYFLDGDLKPLFPESNCRFTVCSVSGDKTKMLTDCPDDAKCIIMWSLENGSEITRTKRNAVVLSFAWSQDGKLLAISHSTGSISIVNAMDGFRTLAETVLPKECGMIKFSPDCRSLCCLHHRRNAQAFCHWNDQKIFLLNINMAKQRGCRLSDSGSYVPWKFESHSEAGFLLGDPIPSVDGAFDFVLDTATLLRSCPFPSCINMLNVSESRKTYTEATLTRISDIVFSLSGETVYVVCDADRLTVSAWDVSSMKLIGQKSRHTDKPNLVAVKEGVILTTASGTLELWNSELSKCVRSWTNAFVVTKIIPVSGERVACEAEDKVIILDTTSGEIASTFRIRSNGSGLVTCNSKCQLLTYDIGGSLKLWDGKTTLWKENLHLSCIPLGFFSLSDQFVVIWALDCVYVLDALSGKTLHVLLEAYRLSDCTFVSDEECVISTVAALGDNCLQLFNVKSGDLLSVIDLENDVHCLAACPCKRLLAIGQSDSKHGFELIQVCLPQDKDSRKSKSLANTPEIEERRENTRCVLV